jgi:hypothetical protein
VHAKTTAAAAIAITRMTGGLEAIVPKLRRQPLMRGCPSTGPLRVLLHRPSVGTPGDTVDLPTLTPPVTMMLQPGGCWWLAVSALF